MVAGAQECLAPATVASLPAVAERYPARNPHRGERCKHPNMTLLTDHRWSRSHTITPDGSQACGGDNIAGQPFLCHGLWHFAWGDCDELGLVLRPTRAGEHTLKIDGYRVPLNARHLPDIVHERIDLHGTYVWHGMVRP